MSKETHPSYISQENVYLYMSFIFSIYMPEFFSVLVSDSKGTKTSNFPLTSISSIGIKTLEWKLTHPSRGQLKESVVESPIKLNKVFPARKCEKVSYVIVIYTTHQPVNNS